MGQSNILCENKGIQCVVSCTCYTCIAFAFKRQCTQNAYADKWSKCVDPEPHASYGNLANIQHNNSVMNHSSNVNNNSNNSCKYSIYDLRILILIYTSYYS